MTKEELKQEAEEYVYKALGFDKDYIKQELNRKHNPIEPWEKSEPIDPIINETLEAYLASAEPRENRIAELERNVAYYAERAKYAELTGRDYVLKNKDLGERYLHLQKDKGNLTDRVRELEQQIEKMKCCLFCAYRNMDWNFSSICTQKDNAKIENPYTCKCDKWEIIEKKDKEVEK